MTKYVEVKIFKEESKAVPGMFTETTAVCISKPGALWDTIFTVTEAKDLLKQLARAIEDF